MFDLLRLARPWHWIKNVFVLLPIPFAIADGARLDVSTLLLGLLGFSLINSAVYVLNDLLDAEADRAHPTKCRRPIASGRVSHSQAIAMSIALLAVGIGLCLMTRVPQATAVALVYLATNILYCLWAKHVALLDVFVLASGFVLRVLLGCFLLLAVPSSWLLLCTSSIALFLAFCKRRGDLVAGLDETHRPSLKGYSLPFLDQSITICAAITLLAYGLYLVESDFLVPGRQFASFPFVAYGILHYLRLAHLEGVGASPVEMAYRSRTLQVCGFLWLAAVFWSLKIG
ncbi:MAG: UbiA prenyltransferase family protein [Planctomycetales bacterium]|nr:UbiA prenyltransferase family protein [Planctomycetales bacterium]